MRAASAQAAHLWADDVRGYRAAIRLEGGTPVDGVVLHALYKRDGMSAACALLLPHGGSVGKWERRGGRETFTAAAFPRAKQLLLAVSRFLDEIIQLQAGDHDKWDLRTGEKFGIVPASGEMLIRTATRNGNRYVVLGEPGTGNPLAVLKLAGDRFSRQDAQWKAVFYETPERVTYRHYHPRFSLEFHITDVIRQNAGMEQ